MFPLKVTCRSLIAFFIQHSGYIGNAHPVNRSLKDFSDKGCPRRAEHLPRFKSREDFIQFTSFQDTHEDEDGNTVGLDIADPNVNVEEEAILETLFTELVEYLGRISPRYAKIVTLGRQDYSKEQIIAKLGLKPSRGYQEINAAKELTKKFLEL